MVVAQVILTFVLWLRKTPEKNQPGKLTRAEIEPRPARREAAMLLLVILMELTFNSCGEFRLSP